MQSEACGRTPSRAAFRRAVGISIDSAVGGVISKMVRAGTGAISTRRSELGRGAIGASGVRGGDSPAHGQTSVSQQGHESICPHPALVALLAMVARIDKPKGEASAKAKKSRTEMRDRNVMERLKISARVLPGANESVGK